VLKRLFVLFTVVFGGFVACYAVFYVLMVWLTVNQLPFGQREAYRWMMGEEGDITLGVPWEGYDGPASALSGLPADCEVGFFFGHDPNYFGGAWHGGVDLECPTGTPVQTTMGGVVSFAGWSDSGYGNLVVVENQGVQTFYGHNSELVVQPGDVVEAGDAVGLSGSTGRSTGPHVHYEVREDGVQVDPLTAVLPGSGE
jgi:murein DD-endopeptidase MepM/ murein hydrolase activator NlpD